ncbi:hypothetical protein ACFWPA_00495 [Rhodococcus sp. NPDC058505]|uniref:hypothetical protein n=1 Tax=unclassified Rhodococcus (in: high G+C Gram-positive bacteria) TaxID=192944 RepID=UPI0036633B0E
MATDQGPDEQADQPTGRGENADRRVNDSWPHLLRLGALVIGFVIVGLLLIAWLNQMA